ncbi:MAG: iron-sulfur cluster assembly scaffold protein [Candidatus Nealsonbacteria bacterium CG01_land_8_20_14_3_00_12]|uniref:Iron-sulfur cluster assembly scaffold protein n=1 Tax=Candidatus Nealsonbacteria bacterium CG01_land_8_20_14_3_00_12 TaxID=1974697 RepID=A0A2M7EBE2_9BACT|nr:MAG: iron-sulfur cluster assembly scaffold protein [Candidatus Nealsonbacteria bacterium CG01_land_8_20_14_3_00_12]
MKLYSKEVMKHFIHPQNVGKMKNYDGLGKAGNLKCGDIMYLYIKVGKDEGGKEIIKNISFETFGCTIAIANTSLLTTMVKGKTLKEALKITKEDLLKRFGRVPLVKIHCSLLAVDALGEAIYDYLSKNKKPIPKELRERHERVERDKEIIEIRHKELVEIEEELHQKTKHIK